MVFPRERRGDAHPAEPSDATKRYDFSRSSMEQRWRRGMCDARIVLAASPWLAPMPEDLGVRVFDVSATVSPDS